MAKPATAAERRHFAKVAALPCLVCGGQSTIHHVTGYADRMGRIARSHKLIVPLAPQYHQIIYDPVSSAPVSVEALGHRGFFQKHGIDLYAEAKRLWDESNGEGDLG